MKKSLLAVVFAFLSAGPAPSVQRGHVLYGDVRLVAKDATPEQPLSFNLVLYYESGNVAARDSVPANGRYRFLGVANGIYDLVVERGGEEVARLHLIIQARQRRPSPARGTKCLPASPAC